MWQIITHYLSIIRTQGLFVVTQIAAVNLVTAKMTFAKAWVPSSECEELFLFQQPATSALIYVLYKTNKKKRLSHRIEATFHTKRSGLVIMMSRYHLFTHILCRRSRLSANKPMIAFTITNVHSVSVPSQSLFWQNVCVKTPPGRSLKTDHIACCETAVTNDLLMWLQSNTPQGWT